MDDDLTLQLSRAEALVLFDFLSRSDEAENFVFEDQAEQRIVWLLQVNRPGFTGGSGVPRV